MRRGGVSRPLFLHSLFVLGANIASNVCAYLTFAYGLSRPDEHKTFSFENVRALAVKRRPYANVAEQFKSTLKGKLSFAKNPEKRIYHCEAGAADGGEPDTRC